MLNPPDNNKVQATDTSLKPGFADWAIGWPITAFLALIVVYQLGSWLPHYLTWPYWVDHDVFADAARAWDRGLLPYRDLRLNNFPGTIYLFYLLGKLGGWGKPAYFYAVDASLLLTLGAVLLAWSRRITDRLLPGIVGYLLFVSYYLSLDYCLAAQRDWHAGCLSVLAMLVVQGWPGRWSRFLSACLMVMALTVRPQVMLFLPAILMMVSVEESAGTRFRQRLVWLFTFAILAILPFLPLILNGLMGDFLHSLRAVSFGSTYNKLTPDKFFKSWSHQTLQLRWLVVPLAMGLLARTTNAASWRMSIAWIVALAGASIYKPISPMAHNYLDTPMLLVWCVTVAYLVHLILIAPACTTTLRLGAILLLLGLGSTTLRPEFCQLGASLQALRHPGVGQDPLIPPPGYRRGPLMAKQYYSWFDYRSMLTYLERSTKPTTKVANVLKDPHTVVSEVDRPSAFPAESITWLRMVRKDDEAVFAKALEPEGDTVVVWAPVDDMELEIDLIESVIRRLYHFEAKFGPIEVWRRNLPVIPATP